MYDRSGEQEGLWEKTVLSAVGGEQEVRFCVMEKTVLCAASSYDKKYYFNSDFCKIPKQVQEELQAMCVIFTEEAGGILLLVFDEEGNLQFECRWDENDLLYDEIEAKLLIGRYRREKRELLLSLEQFYKVYLRWKKTPTSTGGE